MNQAGPGRLLRVLTGCTAVGKSEWALRWAEASGAEIISCDSLLFYRGMDIGTAKPTLSERARVPHHLIDILDPREGMNVARYAELAAETAAKIARRGRPVLVVGGSGFYLRTFFSKVADRWSAPPEVRAKVAAMLERDGLAGLVAEIERLNAGSPLRLDTKNPRRVARALERCLASGMTLAEMAAEFAKLPSPFADWRIELVRLDLAKAELDTRIAARVDRMLEAGLVREVRGLLEIGLRSNPSAAGAIGYREVIAMVEGRLKESELAAEIAGNTRALVRKQRTWFRSWLPPHGVLDAAGLLHERELFPA